MGPTQRTCTLALVGCLLAADANAAQLPFTERVQARAQHERDVEAASEALANGPGARATPKLEAALRADADAQTPATVRFWAADAALAAGEPARALELLGSLWPQLETVGDEVQARRARALEALNRPAEAAAAWQEVARLFPRGPWARAAAFALPRSLLAAGYAHGAADAWRRALSAHPQAPEAPAARLALADLAAAAGSSQRAAPAWQQLLATADPNVAQAARERLANLRAAGGLGPPSVDELLHVVDARITQRQLDEAGTTLDEAQGRANGARETARVGLRRAELMRRRRDRAGARLQWQQLVADAPAEVRADALADWAAFELNGPTPKAAVPLYARLAASTRGHAQREAQFNTGLASFFAGDDAAAEQVFDRYSARYPRDPRADEAVWYAGWCAYRRGAHASAERTLSRLVSRYPRSGLRFRAWYWRGRIAQRANAPARAKAAFTHAAADDSGYYALLARDRLADPAGASKAAGLFAAGGPAQAASVVASQMAAPSDAPDCARPAAATAAAFEPPPAAPLGESLDWARPEGLRAAWLMRLGLVREAAEAVQHVPAAPGAASHGAGVARGNLLYALGAYNAAMHVGVNLLGGAQGWPGAQSAAQKADALRLAFPRGFDNLVQEGAHEFGVEPGLIWAIMRQESAFITTARSTSMARGLMQVMPQTGRAIAARLQEEGYSDQDILAPHTNVRFGAWYLMALLNNYRGNLPLAVAAYNAGPVAVDDWLTRTPGAPLDEFVENVPFRETRLYVKHVLVNLDVYRQLDGGAALQLPADVAVQSTRFVTF